MRFSLVLVAATLYAQAPDFQVLTQAYQALQRTDYEAALAGFENVLQLAPERASVHKDAAYTCLKMGENRKARLHFRRAMELDPGDTHTALEYAFLSFEAPDDAIQAKAEARRIFNRIRAMPGDSASAKTAAEAFENIDGPLRIGIARWSAALKAAAPSFSVHFELAQLAEQRDELDLAYANYLAAFRLQPEKKALLIDIGRVEALRNHPEQSIAALLGASRGGEPRAADKARELLPARYPYVYEFRNALALDPGNTELHRELAYLLLRMELKTEAEAEFHEITIRDPADLLSAAQLGFLLLSRGEKALALPLLNRVLEGSDEPLNNRVRLALHLPTRLSSQATESPGTVSSEDARVMYERSYRAGYLHDALKYLEIAHEADPEDSAVMLKMGWTYNLLHDDRTALSWFRRARASSDPDVASEAKKAFNNLRPEFARFRTTAWVLPFFSTRWHDAFSYGQVKTELRLDGIGVRPYASVRFIGDTRQTTSGPNPQSLSESSFLVAAGLIAQSHGVTAWGEAGTALSYKRGSALPDYRGGLSWSKGWGHLLNAEAPGVFLETNADEVFLSRYENDFLTYSQWRGGWTRNGIQFLWNANLTIDSNRQAWANFVETGPGIRLHVPGAPAGLAFSVNGYRGAYLLNRGNPQRPNFFDVRAGFWYAFTH